MTTEQILPAWLRAAHRFTPETHAVKKMLRELGLHTVCEEARCPNISECFSNRTATFMILGDICTRNCAFCGCGTGRPRPVDPMEPVNVANAAGRLGLKHCVVTSVTRDDLEDGGASQFVKTIEAIREQDAGMTVEVLTPDFGGKTGALKTVVSARPEVLNINLETIRRLFPRVRPGGSYQRPLDLLSLTKRLDSGIITKSGFMIGLGETLPEVEAMLSDLASAGVDIVAIGQYMRPSRRNVAVSKYYEPSVFEDLVACGKAKGIRNVLAGPLVRSSYKAAELVNNIANDYASRRVP